MVFPEEVRLDNKKRLHKINKRNFFFVIFIKQ